MRNKLDGSTWSRSESVTLVRPRVSEVVMVEAWMLKIKIWECLQRAVSGVARDALPHEEPLRVPRCVAGVGD